MGMTHELKFSFLSMGRGAWPKQFLRLCTGRDPCLLPPSHRHQFSDVHDDMEGWGTAGWRSRVTLSVTSAVHRWNGAAPEHGTGASVPALCPLPRLTWRHAPSPKRVRLNSCGRHGACLPQPVSYQNQQWGNLFHLPPKYISEFMATPEIGRIFANAVHYSHPKFCFVFARQSRVKFKNADKQYCQAVFSDYF